MSVPAPKIASQLASGQLDAPEILARLNSEELVIAFSGPLGSGVADVRAVVIEKLVQLNYETVTIKLSALIRSSVKYLNDPPGVSELDLLQGVERYKEMQKWGNRLREAKGSNFLALLAVGQIQLDRKKRHPDSSPASVMPKRVAYLIDQLKHPDECELLRKVYGDCFFLIGTLCSSDARKRNLLREGIDSFHAEELMEIDRRQDEKHGQKLEKTLQLADFFVRNSKANTKELSSATDRFLDLVHGAITVTPTRVEQGMYAAYSASVGSACLSRQVGAAIQDRDGNIIAKGCNDVPKAGGGLYAEGIAGDDQRCMHLHGGTCFNHLEKEEIRKEIQRVIFSVLKSELPAITIFGTDNDSVSTRLATMLARSVREGSRLKDLIEFSRSVHAEMDAITSLSRSGRGAAQDGILYTTTYPCHNCARHIIAAGIRAVYFIEPYEKSLAKKLHSDAIIHELDSEPGLEDWQARKEGKKVAFLHFEGVAPSKYLRLFEAVGDRKDAKTGKMKLVQGRIATKKMPQELEGYPLMEARVLKLLSDGGIEVPAL